MLSTEFLILAGGCALVLLVFGVQLRKITNFVAKTNKRSVSLRRIAELEATLTELSDAYAALLDSHKKLRSRISMRQLREKRGNGSDIPDPASDPAGWKRAMRLQLRREGVLK